MTSSPQTPFAELQRIAAKSGIGPALDYLEQNVRREKNYAALFEVLKMRVRHGMKLPLLYSDIPDVLSEEDQRMLEDGLITACREVGTLLMKEGDVQQGWMYLQPVGDRELNLKLLKTIEPDDENIDLLIDTAITQGAAPAYGYRLLLEHYGTCNGITTFETQSMAFDRATQKEMACVLLDHIYKELMSNIRYSLGQCEPPIEVPEDASLAETMRQHPDLCGNGAHHIDTTHLASLMRISRLADDCEHLMKAYELAAYGSRLASDFHYPGHAPFEDTYTDHLQYFGALVSAGDVDVPAAIEHFRKKLETVDSEQHGPIATETLVDFLFRLGRNSEALDVTITLLLGKFPSMGIAPDPMTIANTEELRDRLIAYYRDQNDLVSFAAGVLGR